MLFRRTKSLVGLDIGSSSVKAIELKPAGKGFRVSAIGVETVPQIVSYAHQVGLVD